MGSFVKGRKVKCSYRSINRDSDDTPWRHKGHTRHTRYNQSERYMLTYVNLVNDSMMLYYSFRRLTFYN